jgi:hypothetical protein
VVEAVHGNKDMMEVLIRMVVQLPILLMVVQVYQLVGQAQQFIMALEEVDVGLLVVELELVQQVVED